MLAKSGFSNHHGLLNFFNHCKSKTKTTKTISAKSSWYKERISSLKSWKKFFIYYPLSIGQKIKNAFNKWIGIKLKCSFFRLLLKIIAPDTYKVFFSLLDSWIALFLNSQYIMKKKIAEDYEVVNSMWV